MESVSWVDFDCIGVTKHSELCDWSLIESTWLRDKVGDRGIGGMLGDKIVFALVPKPMVAGDSEHCDFEPSAVDSTEMDGSGSTPGDFGSVKLPSVADSVPRAVSGVDPYGKTAK